MSSVILITTSLRAGSNSDRLADEVERGAKDAGCDVVRVSLKGKEIKFCKGCLACQKTQRCVIKDDAVEIAERIGNADALVYFTPIYYYEMSGQMKTLLDRCNPLYTSDYKFRKVYLVTTAAEDDDRVPEKAIAGLQGWIDCFEKATLAGTLFCGGVNDAKEVEKYAGKLTEAYNFGRNLNQK